MENLLNGKNLEDIEFHPSTPVKYTATSEEFHFGPNATPFSTSSTRLLDQSEEAVSPKAVFEDNSTTSYIDDKNLVLDTTFENRNICHSGGNVSELATDVREEDLMPESIIEKSNKPGSLDLNKVHVLPDDVSDSDPENSEEYKIAEERKLMEEVLKRCRGPLKPGEVRVGSYIVQVPTTPEIDKLIQDIGISSSDSDIDSDEDMPPLEVIDNKPPSVQEENVRMIGINMKYFDEVEEEEDRQLCLLEKQRKEMEGKQDIDRGADSSKDLEDQETKSISDETSEVYEQTKFTPGVLSPEPLYKEENDLQNHVPEPYSPELNFTVTNNDQYKPTSDYQNVEISDENILPSESQKIIDLESEIEYIKSTDIETDLKTQILQDSTAKVEPLEMTLINNVQPVVESDPVIECNSVEAGDETVLETVTEIVTAKTEFLQDHDMKPESLKVTSSVINPELDLHSTPIQLEKVDAPIDIPISEPIPTLAAETTKCGNDDTTPELVRESLELTDCIKSTTVLQSSEPTEELLDKSKNAPDIKDSVSELQICEENVEDILSQSPLTECEPTKFDETNNKVVMKFCCNNIEYLLNLYILKMYLHNLMFPITLLFVITRFVLL